MSKPEISKRVFWDVNAAEIDYEKDCFFVIERVLNYGVWNDFKSLLQYYGDATIKERKNNNILYLKVKFIR